VRSRRDFGLYLVTDRELCLGRRLEEVVELAVRGGVSLVQLREKSCSTREYIEIGRRLQKILKPQGIPLIINDRVDVALAVGADGVHLGQADMAYQDARRLLGRRAIIGISAETMDMDQAEDVETLDIDYLAVSPIFPTPTKTDTKAPWGLEGLQQLRQRSRHILVGIGGINPSNAAEVLEAGADGLAVVSAICSAPDPENASRRLREIIDCYGREKMRTQ
jgi:thiamine-phosphate pyrophosphorylase